MGKKTEFEVRDLRQREKFVVDDLLVDKYGRFLGIYAIGVYVALCRHANKDQVAWPSIGTLARELNISVPMVDGSLWVLEQFKIIKKRRIGRTCSNRYWLLDKKEWLSLSPNAVDKFLSDLNNIKNTDLNSVKITIKRRLNHLLTTFKSNSKETHSKETHRKADHPSDDASIDNVIIFSHKKLTKKEIKNKTSVVVEVEQLGFPLVKFLLSIKSKSKSGVLPPAEVIISACKEYLKKYKHIDNPWGWFTQVVCDESRAFYAERNAKRGSRYRKEPAIIGQILARMAKQQETGLRM
jgi:hypothetical protein